ncbi:MAG TPA: 50S ribosomal protein L21 [Pseudolabrys sp.]|nr:50S ribosomal protein L21 [Pseudolabrys sp.]
MFAVIKAGGKQYRVAAEDVIRIDRVSSEPGQIVEFGEVLVVGGDKLTVGAPTVAGATVAGEVLHHDRGDKVIAFKKRRRKNSRRKRGYRHEFSVIRITEILTDGAKPSKEVKARPKPAPKPKAEAAEGETAEAAPVKKKAKKPAAKAKAKAATKGKKK